MASARRRGFTLIETVMAIVILAVAVPPMLWAVRQAHDQRANPVMASTARWLAVEKLEDMIADRHSTDAAFGYANLSGGTENPVPGHDGYVRTTAVSEHGAWDNVGQTWSAGTGYTTITVTVQWTNAHGDSQNLSISTVVTDYTP
jgi:prepilin-type N-terminal cleavage/methylation domain-containing protein